MATRRKIPPARGYNPVPYLRAFRLASRGNYKVEVFLKGEFTTIDVFLEGKEIPLREINDGDYYKLYSSFEILDPLDIHVRLKGWYSMDWSFAVKVNDKEVFKKEGEFDVKGFVTFTEKVKI